MDPQAPVPPHWLITWLPVLSIASTALTGILVWGFASGRWLQKQEDGKTNTERGLADLRGDVERRFMALQNELHAFDRALREEDHKRQESVERVNVALGRLAERVSVFEREAKLVSEFWSRERENIDRRLTALDLAVSQLRERQK